MFEITLDLALKGASGKEREKILHEGPCWTISNICYRTGLDNILDNLH